MNLLLDTHVLLWAASAPERLSEQAVELLADPHNALHFSVASLWEVVIKTGLNRPDFRVDPHLLRRGLLENGYQELSVTARHVLEVSLLPTIHKDPFDRLMVAQAISEGFLLLTADELVASYPISVHKV